MNAYHTSLLDTIRDAYDRLSPIDPARWLPNGFYDHATGRSDMFGWYVRTMPEYAADAPGGISGTQYRVRSASLANAINKLLTYCLPEYRDPVDAYGICIGWHPAFQEPTPYERCMACLKMILDTCDVKVPPLDARIGQRQPGTSQERALDALDAELAAMLRRTPSATRYYPLA